MHDYWRENWNTMSHSEKAEAHKKKAEMKKEFMEWRKKRS